MRRAGILAGALLALVAASACETAADDPPASEGNAGGSGDAGDTSAYTAERMRSDFVLFPGRADPFSAMIELSDGRRVSMFYAEERGLAEQHYSPEADAWTEPQMIYRTDTDPCQVLELEESGGTVAAIANWGVFCYDGEPPFESIAAVATGDLTEWRVDLTEGFDGWASVVVDQTGAAVEWRKQDDALTWEEGAGFSGGVGARLR